MRLLTFILCLLATTVFAATPSFDSFDTNYFSTVGSHKLQLNTNNYPLGGSGGGQVNGIVYTNGSGTNTFFYNTTNQSLSVYGTGNVATVVFKGLGLGGQSGSISLNPIGFSFGTIPIIAPYIYANGYLLTNIPLAAITNVGTAAYSNSTAFELSGSVLQATNDLSTVLKAYTDTATNQLSTVLKAYSNTGTNDSATRINTATNALSGVLKTYSDTGTNDSATRITTATNALSAVLKTYSDTGTNDSATRITTATNQLFLTLTNLEVPQVRTLSLNGSSFDLSANRTVTVPLPGGQMNLNAGTDSFVYTNTTGGDFKISISTGILTVSQNGTTIMFLGGGAGPASGVNVYQQLNVQSGNNFRSTGSILNDALTQSRLVVASGATPPALASVSTAGLVNGDGSTATAANINSLFPVGGNILTNGESLATVFSNNISTDATHQFNGNGAGITNVTTLKTFEFGTIGQVALVSGTRSFQINGPCNITAGTNICLIPGASRVAVTLTNMTLLAATNGGAAFGAGSTVTFNFQTNIWNNFSQPILVDSGFQLILKGDVAGNWTNSGTTTVVLPAVAAGSYWVGALRATGASGTPPTATWSGTYDVLTTTPN